MMIRLMIEDYSGAYTTERFPTIEGARGRAEAHRSGSYDNSGKPYSVGVYLYTDDYKLIETIQEAQK